MDINYHLLLRGNLLVYYDLLQNICLIYYDLMLCLLQIIT